MEEAHLDSRSTGRHRRCNIPEGTNCLELMHEVEAVLTVAAAQRAVGAVVTGGMHTPQ